MQWFGWAGLIGCVMACSAKGSPAADDTATLRQVLGPVALAPSDGQVGDSFGHAVAISGDTAIIGAAARDQGGQLSRGAVYLFLNDGSKWVQDGAPLVLSDLDPSIQFGRSVAISGDVAVVGVSQHAAAYVMVRDGGSWTRDFAVLRPQAGNSDQSGFGWSVAVSGETIIVGAPHEDIHGEDQGAAYVFARGGSNWVQQARLLAADGRAFDGFGNAVAISGETAVIGADARSANSEANQTNAYVFVRENGNWMQQGEALVADDGKAGDFKHNQTAISGDTIIVTAPYADAEHPDQGAGHVFIRQDGSFIQQGPRLTAADGNRFDQLGQGVALSPDVAFLSAKDLALKGLVYPFIRDAFGWGEQATLMGTVDWDQFGFSIGISAEHLIVGAPGPGLRRTSPGVAYIFNLPQSVNETDAGDAMDATLTDVYIDATSDGTNDQATATEGSSTEPFIFNRKGCDCNLAAADRSRLPGVLLGLALALACGLRKRKQASSTG